MPKILVFDSGLGGLSILSEITSAIPDASFVYVADTDFFPYGTKSEAALVKRVPKVIEAIVSAYSPDIGVVACNSASTVALDAVRERVAIPIVGTVPAVKPAAEQSASKVIGLLATPGTIERDYTDDLIEAFAPNCRVLRHGTADLVSLAEQKLMTGSVDLGDIHAATQGLFLQDSNSAIDAVVLACTHFPLVLDELVQAWPDRNIAWIDSGEAIARRVVSVLSDGQIQVAGNKARSIGVVTRKGPDFATLATIFASFGLETMDVKQI